MATFEGIGRNIDNVPAAVFKIGDRKVAIVEEDVYDVIDFLKKYGLDTKTQDKALAALLAFED